MNVIFFHFNRIFLKDCYFSNPFFYIFKKNVVFFSKKLFFFKKGVYICDIYYMKTITTTDMKTTTTTSNFTINEIEIYMKDYMNYLSEISETVSEDIFSIDYIDYAIETENISAANEMIKRYDILSFSDFVSLHLCTMIDDENNQYEICEKMINEIRISKNNAKLSTLLYSKFLSNLNNFNFLENQIDIDELYADYIQSKSDSIMKLYSSITSEYNMTEIEIMKNIRI